MMYWAEGGDICFSRYFSRSEQPSECGLTNQIFFNEG